MNDISCLLISNKMKFYSKLLALIPKCSFNVTVDHVHECRDELIPEEMIKFDHILPISAQQGLGMDKAKEVIRDVLDHYAREAKAEARSR